MTRWRRATALVRAAQARQRRVEAWLERRYPMLYDARHAARGFGHVLWPLLGPLLAALVLLPVFALLVLLWTLLGLEAPSIDLPDLPDLPDIPFPEVTVPGWLQAIGDALGAAAEAFWDSARYIAIALAVGLGVYQTRAVRRRRAAAEQIGRPELLRRLAVTLGAVAARATARGAVTLADVRCEQRREEDP
jgi:hypothetical protein